MLGGTQSLLSPARSHGGYGVALFVSRPSKVPFIKNKISLIRYTPHRPGTKWRLIIPAQVPHQRPPHPRPPCTRCAEHGGMLRACRAMSVLRYRNLPDASHTLRVSGTLTAADSFLVLGLKGNEMRLSLLAALLVAAWALPAEAARPVKGAVQGTVTAATGVARGAGQAGVGMVRGTSTAVRGTARGLRCAVTLGNRC